MLTASFATAAEAVAHAKHHGGWIAVLRDDKAAIWFNAEAFTLTPVLREVARRGGGEVGAWPLFDPQHECHKFLSGETDTVVVLEN